MLANGVLGATCCAATDSGVRGAVVSVELGVPAQPLVKTNSDTSTVDRLNIRMALWVEPLTHIPNGLITLERWNSSASSQSVSLSSAILCVCVPYPAHGLAIWPDHIVFWVKNTNTRCNQRVANRTHGLEQTTTGAHSIGLEGMYAMV